MKSASRRFGQTALWLPTSGFEAPLFGGLFDAVVGPEAALTLSSALAHGMNYVDTAPSKALDDPNAVLVINCMGAITYFRADSANAASPTSAGKWSCKRI
jgi:hypothetical protein